MRFRTLVAVAACGVGLSLNNIAVAQQAQAQPAPTANQAQQGRAGQAGQQTNWQNNDQLLANCVAIANQTEVAIAKHAQDKAKNKDVKDFAQTLVKDHQGFLKKLQKYAPETTRDGYLNDRTETANSNVQPAGGEVRNSGNQIQQTSGTSAQPINIIQLQREVAEECIRNAKKGMEKKDPSEFDECFIGFQIAAHAQMKDKLTVFQRHVSPELNQVLAEGLQTTEQHLKKAEELMKQLRELSDSRESTAKSK